MKQEYIEYIANNLHRLEEVKTINAADKEIITYIDIYERGQEAMKGIPSAVEYFTDIFTQYPELRTLIFGIRWYKEVPASAQLHYIVTDYTDKNYSWEKAALEDSNLHSEIQDIFDYIDMAVWSQVLYCMGAKKNMVLNSSSYPQELTIEELLIPEHLKIYNAIRFYEKYKLSSIITEKPSKGFYKI